jgi:uncharacterized protein
MKKIIIAGGSGFIGQSLTKHFESKGIQTIILTRQYSEAQKHNNFVLWDGKTLGPWSGVLEDADALINLSGKSVDCRYTEKNKKLIMSSRVDSTAILGKAINECKNPPHLWINSSTATIYRDSADKAMNEDTGEIGNDFSMSVAQAWEKALTDSDTPQTRKISLRISLVLGEKSGVYPVLKTLTKLGLGGKHGNGKQVFAWIHMTDIIRIVDFALDNKTIDGPINCVAPEVINNKQFTKALRDSLGVPIGIPTPALLLEIGCFVLRTESELILKSRYVEPKRLLDNGFKFKFTTAIQALNDLNQ